MDSKNFFYLMNLKTFAIITKQYRDDGSYDKNGTPIALKTEKHERKPKMIEL
jgi:hypothetical protein